ncbi:hypothetical protein [Metabacillus sp. cB07]|uniref:hypothetical protein n=1 Tax=Metabacillus sp. cB07 TaxID=2806989 RepID=UPI001939808C|nr:hypothetical protein [Metabacillus sp. cB07]
MMRKADKKNEFRIDGGLVYIKLFGKYEGREAITDIKSFMKYNLGDYLWRSDKKGYVYSFKDGKVIAMHRLITENESKLHTDHINNTDDPVADKLDNRACNLRIASNRENQCNSRLHSKNSTGYKGISLDKGLYKAQTKFQGHKYYFGGFKSEKYEKALEMAAYAYDIATEWINGEFASHNNVLERELLSEEEKKIVEDIAYSYIQKHKLSRYQKENETASIGVDTISEQII